MKAIQTSSGQIDIQEVLTGIVQLKITDLEGFVNQAIKILEKKKSPNFIEKEKELIDKIKNGGPSEDFWKAYDVLANKLRDETITNEENQAFIEMNTSTEEWAVERLRMMMELAELWGVSLDAVRKYLNIEPRKIVYA